MDKVQLPRVDSDIRDKLNKFKADFNLEFPSDRLENLSEVLDRLLKDSKLVGQLEEELKTANEKIKELDDTLLKREDVYRDMTARFADGLEEKNKRIEQLEEDIAEARKQIKELEEKGE